jgi:Protein of unknown function (DUF5818)
MAKSSLLSIGLIVFSGLTSAQDSTLQPSPALPAEILGPPLIVWSQAQNPGPVPQPLPPPGRDGQAQATQTQDTQSDQPSAPVFTGTIIKTGSSYALKTKDGTVYQIDDQQRAKAFDGRQVRVSGRLDSATNMLHITSMELVS